MRGRRGSVLTSRGGNRKNPTKKSSFFTRGNRPQMEKEQNAFPRPYTAPGELGGNIEVGRSSFFESFSVILKKKKRLTKTWRGEKAFRKLDPSCSPLMETPSSGRWAHNLRARRLLGLQKMLVSWPLSDPWSKGYEGSADQLRSPELMNSWLQNCWLPISGLR